MEQEKALTLEQIESFAAVAASLAESSTYYLLTPSGCAKIKPCFTDRIDLPNGKRVIIKVEVED